MGKFPCLGVSDLAVDRGQWTGLARALTFLSARRADAAYFSSHFTSTSRLLELKPNECGARSPPTSLAGRFSMHNILQQGLDDTQNHARGIALNKMH